MIVFDLACNVMMLVVTLFIAIVMAIIIFKQEKK